MSVPTALIEAIEAKAFRTYPMDNDKAIYRSDLLPILEAHFAEPVTVELFHHFLPRDYWRLDLACSVCKWKAEASYEAKPHYLPPADISIDVWLKDLAQTASVGAVYANCPHATRQYLEPILAAKIRELLKEKEEQSGRETIHDKRGG